MTISETFRDKAGSLYSPDGESLVLRHDADAVANDFGAGDDIARIEFEGEIAMVEGPQTDASLAAAMITLKGDKFDKDRKDEIAGNRAGYIQVTGLGEIEKNRKQASAKARRDGDARMQMLLALQAQLDDLYKERNQGLGEYLSPEELAAINALPREDQDQAIRDKMREKLEDGEISQEEYDEWKAWYENWSDREIETRQAIDRMEAAATVEQMRQVVNDVGAATGEKAAEKLDAPKREVADTAVGNNWHDGNAARLDGFTSELGELDLSGDDLFSSGTSFANTADPNSSLRESAPQMQFNQVAQQTAAVKPDAQIDLTRQTDATPSLPSGGMG